MEPYSGHEKGDKAEIHENSKEAALNVEQQRLLDKGAIDQQNLPALPVILVETPDKTVRQLSTVQDPVLPRKPKSALIRDPAATMDLCLKNPSPS